MNYAPEFIGVGKYTTELAGYLQQQGSVVEVVTALPHYPGWTVRSSRPWRYERRREAGIRITACPLLARPSGRVWRLVAPLSFALAAAPVVLWRSWRLRPDTVLCVEPTLFAAPAALLAARLVGARAVLHVQDLEIDAAFATGYLAAGGLRRLALACERALLARFDRLVTISDAMAGRLRERGVAATRLRVLRNWIAPADAPPAVDWRARFGLPEEARVVLYAGNLGAKQGLAVLIEAARALRADQGVRFVVVGDGPMLPRLRAAAASLPNLTLLGLLPQRELASLLAGTDLHLLPQDGAASDLVFPSKLGPMLASGRPIVVTADRASELGRWLGAAATLTPPGDGQALAAAIRAAVRHGFTWDRQRAADLAAALDASAILPAFAQCLMAPAPPVPEVSRPAACLRTT